MATNSVTDSVSSGATSLISLVDGGGNYTTISSYLNALPQEQKLAEMLSISGSRVGKLYRAVAGGPPVTIASFMPADAKPGDTVIYEGRNSLLAFTRFQKRFCYGKDGGVVGYNHQTMGWFTGPGYFVCADGDETHPNELLFDYTQEPSFFPEGWPKYKKNTSGTSTLVYAHMKDYCRRVADGVVVGEAFKNGKAVDAFFSLTMSR